MTLSEELMWRGFVQDSTYKDLAQIDIDKPIFYHGFDASADSQTIGNLAAMMFDKVLMRHGCKAIILAGGATSLIGDPGGKDTERPLQTAETIAHNVECAKKQLEIIFKGHAFTLVNNIDWTESMSILEFLRDIGKHYSMTPLVQRDYIAKRMGEGGAGITYTEFSYTLLQGMDYLHLFDKYGVTLQLGGSDQWGNCLSGVDLIRRARGKETHVVTIPLIINQSTGKKFGKSEEGAVWLDPAKTSSYKFYQFWLNSDDKGVEMYLKVYTEFDKQQVDKIMAEHASEPSKRIAQKALARSVTALVHGESAADAVQLTTDKLFGGKIQDLDKWELSGLADELDSFVIDQSSTLCDAVASLGVSKSEARKLIQQGAITVNGLKMLDPTAQLKSVETLHGYILIKKGKNSFVIAHESTK
jgi:tyrosyl-tRNA synthetase